MTIKETKTLNDFRCEADNCCDRDNCKNQLIRVDSLRQEAIKIAKYLISQGDESTSRLTDSYLQGKLDMLEEFFNLTGEDLK